MLNLIEVSEIGLAENELALLLGDFNSKQEYDKLKCAQLLRQLKPFLRNTYSDGVQLISFFHKSLHDVCFLFL